MSMEILGKRGGYFGIQAGGWYDLASYFNLIAPDICTSCKYWYSNDYDGLDVAGAVALADALQAEIDAGRTAVYAAFEHPQRKPDPDDIFAEEPRDPHPFVENVTDFVAFLRKSGGFEIW